MFRSPQGFRGGLAFLYLLLYTWEASPWYLTYQQARNWLIWLISTCGVPVSPICSVIVLRRREPSTLVDHVRFALISSCFAISRLFGEPRARKFCLAAFLISQPDMPEPWRVGISSSTAADKMGGRIPKSPGFPREGRQIRPITWLGHHSQPKLAECCVCHTKHTVSISTCAWLLPALSLSASWRDVVGHSNH